MNLTTLPLLPLEKIASYLDFSSLATLAASTSSLAHLQPKVQHVKGEDFSVAGISRRSEKRNHDPEHYFDVEVKTRGLLGIKMVWEWEGQVSRGVHKKIKLIKLDCGSSCTSNVHNLSSGSCVMDGAELIQRTLRRLRSGYSC